MAFSGGTFSRTFDCTTDRDNGVKILASKFDTELDGFATGLSTCILKDGTQTCTAAIPFAEGLTVPDNKTIILGTNSDITIQYDESTNDSLEIAANVEGAALGIVLKADQGDDNADQHKLNIADGGVLTLGSKISGSFVNYLTHTPNSTVASSTTAVAGNLTVGGDLTLGSGAVISEAELEVIDGVTAGTVTASKAVIVDSNKDIASFRNVTLTGELDAGSLDISGDADIDGTLEADAMTLNGTAITATATLDTGISNNNVPKFTSGVADDDFLRVAGTAIEGRSASEVLSDIGAAPAAGSSNIVTTGALNSGSITSGFGSIDNGSSAITTTGVITGGTLEATADTSAGDNAAIGYTAAEGLILTGQGSTSDITLKNDADATVFSVPTGTDDILFPDNAKILMGDSSDLQIYHSGNDSYILDSGTGDLYLAGENNVRITSNTGLEAMATLTANGAVTLFHDNAAKVATTSTGVDVTGTTTTDGLEVKNGTTQQLVIGNSGSYAGAEYGELLFKEGSTELARVKWNPSGNTFQLINNIAGPMTFATNNTTRMTITSGGSVGIGTSSPSGVLHTAGSGDQTVTFQAGGESKLEMKIDGNSDGCSIRFSDSDAASQGQIRYQHSTDALSFYTNGNNERLRIDNGGNVGINNASPSQKLHVHGAAEFNAYDNTSGSGGYNANGLLVGNAYDAGKGSSVTDDRNSIIWNERGLDIDFATSNTYRMKLAHDGVLMVGNSASIGNGRFQVDATSDFVYCQVMRANASNAGFVLFQKDDGSTIGQIDHTASATRYLTSSDHRLKETVLDMTGAIDRVKALAPKRFNFIADPDDTTVDGFLAHEAQTVVPEAVSGTHNEVETWTQQEIDDGDAPDGTSAGDNKLDGDGNTIPVMQGIDQSKLVPLLTAALKESIAKIETLETKVAALEAGS